MTTYHSPGSKRAKAQRRASQARICAQYGESNPHKANVLWAQDFKNAVAAKTKVYFVHLSNHSRSILSNGGDTVGPLSKVQADYLVKNFPRWMVNTGNYFPKARFVTPKEGERVLTAEQYMRWQGPSAKEEFAAL